MNRIENILYISLVALLFLFAMAWRWGGGIADDGAFFLMYAKNITEGQFWIWNIGEHPIWGASAPLFPLFLAIPLKIGFAPIESIVLTGLTLGVAAFTITSYTLWKYYGSISAILFTFLAATNSHLMWYAGVSGLETPLTVLLISLAFYFITVRSPWTLVFAGIIAVNKLDLAPLAFMLALTYGWLNRNLKPKWWIIFIGIPLCWYIFAWVYFGSPLPNSFTTKAFFQDQERVITWTWFGKFILIEHYHWVAWLVLILGSISIYKQKVWVVVPFITLIISHIIAYTIKYPFEPYTWYPMPAIYCLFFSSSIAMQCFYNEFKNIKFIKEFLFICLLIVFFCVGVSENKVTSSIKHYVNFENDRVRAGEWVSLNTPKSFDVFTYWGNTAFFSERYVIDGSFLNRKFEKGDVIKKYTPSVLILDPEYREGYTLVHVEERAKSTGVDYPFGVHIRNDLMKQVTDVDTSLSDCGINRICFKKTDPLMKALSNIVLGDIHGAVHEYKSANSIFVHPGATTPTRFDLTINGTNLSKSSSNTLKFSIAEDVPIDAVKRGASDVNVTILFDGVSLVSSKNVKFGSPFEFKLERNGTYSIVVDNNGSADTDWLIVSIN